MELNKFIGMKIKSFRESRSNSTRFILREDRRRKPCYFNCLNFLLLDNTGWQKNKRGNFCPFSAPSHTQKSPWP